MSEPRIPWTHQPTGRTDARDRRARSSERLALLADAPLFEGLAKTQLRRIAKVSGARTIHPGEELVKEGVPGRVFYIVVEGRAKIVRRGRTVAHVGPGDSFGEMAILTTALRSASVVAETPMEVLTLSGPHLRTILLEQPRIAVRLLDTLATRLADLDQRFTS
ncbi:MAG: cyclic nucleotide-binding domain-containing protein [Actinomycetota bacterium]|nr:cyclic nucleotide-binding domain-containing protein [Actinomycetota bacterium]